MEKHRSFFFPLLLIAVGVVWLLMSMNVIPAANLWALTHIWPYLLIVLGLGLILRSQWPASRTFVSVLIVAGAVAAIVFAPQLGWAGGPNWDAGFGMMGSVPGSGRIKTEKRAANDFNEISIEYPAEVVVQQGKSASVVVEADDNLLKQLSTEVKSGKLRIRVNESEWSKRVKPSQTVKITITVEDLRAVDFSSAGSLKINGLETEYLTITLSGAGEVNLIGIKVGKLDCSLSGAGDINANGVADKVNVEIDGFGSFDGKDLKSNDADVTINGAGDVTVRVKDNLAAEINGAGSVDYYGTPEVDKHINGAGNVKQMGK